MWFITGCSIGFGREFARAVLARGWRCVATARNQTALDDLAPEAGERLLKVALDVTDPAQIAAAVAQAREHFGAIDVLVNNAGYGYQSSIEEGEEQQIRAQFDANVFGLFALTRAVLPVMREQKRGHVINITSVAGLAGFPGSGYYAASKHAVNQYILVRTLFSGLPCALRILPKRQRGMPAYTATCDSVRRSRRLAAAQRGNRITLSGGRSSMACN
ncbi:SDR family NAD(P)-dependent oxidoreductase [Paraburkholderia sp. J94]|uniref:SDR family NAD(P)-dependent oxidoreductase n=1 Tax=Paraburkholderia sp. J94 TaxID=2805441 RepID=UPI002AB1C628|nr:SDR family NAD(P)-dependent oxidoreductase [Paraburkholderia sp. J94]